MFNICGNIYRLAYILVVNLIWPKSLTIFKKFNWKLNRDKYQIIVLIWFRCRLRGALTTRLYHYPPTFSKIILMPSQDKGFSSFTNAPMAKLDFNRRTKSRKNTRKWINHFLTQMARQRMLYPKILTGEGDLTQTQTSKEILTIMVMFALTTIKVKIKIY